MSDADRSRDPIFLGWLAETRKLLAENGGAGPRRPAVLDPRAWRDDSIDGAGRMIIKFVDSTGRVSYEDMVINDVYLSVCVRPHTEDVAAARERPFAVALAEPSPRIREQHFIREILSYPEGFIGPLESSPIYAGRGHTDVVVFVEGDGGGWLGWEH